MSTLFRYRFRYRRSGPIDRAWTPSIAGARSVQRLRYTVRAMPASPLILGRGRFLDAGAGAADPARAEVAAVGAGEPRRGRALPGWLRRARELLDDAPAAPLTVADVAAVAGVHPVHLARAFRRAFGCSPGEHLRQRRLARAQALLLTTRLPLAEIALRVGFSDQSRMTHAFAAAVGCAPGRVRRLARG